MKIYTTTNNNQVNEIFDWLDDNRVRYSSNYLGNNVNSWTIRREDATAFVLKFGKYMRKEYGDMIIYTKANAKEYFTMHRWCSDQEINFHVNSANNVKKYDTWHIPNEYATMFILRFGDYIVQDPKDDNQDSV